MIADIINDVANAGANPISLSAILDEVVALLPIVLPVLIGFIAFRKGYKFVINALRGA